MHLSKPIQNKFKELFTQETVLGENLSPVFNNKKEKQKALIITSCIHGIERITSKVHYELIQEFGKQISKNMDIYSIPICNIFGYEQEKRSNKNGVDLMRNGAYAEKDAWKSSIGGGQSFSSKLPYYTGKEGIEIENRILYKTINEIVNNHKETVRLDIHSGIGWGTALWVPRNFSSPLPNSSIKKQPYPTRGDIKYRMYQDFTLEGKKEFLPITVEIGSWERISKSFFSDYWKKPWDHMFNPPVKNEEHYITQSKQIILQFLSEENH